MGDTLVVGTGVYWPDRRKGIVGGTNRGGIGGGDGAGERVVEQTRTGDQIWVLMQTVVTNFHRDGA